jgi:hypothetical protein
MKFLGRIAGDALKFETNPSKDSATKNWRRAKARIARKSRRQNRGK